jgi:Piwi domain
VKAQLKAFYKQSRRKPQRLIFYRDGVSEGQFAEVQRCEIPQIRAACEAIEPGYQPNITFIVVQKRHHTRLFPLQKQDMDKSGNCVPGAVPMSYFALRKKATVSVNFSSHDSGSSMKNTVLEPIKLYAAQAPCTTLLVASTLVRVVY